MLAHARWLDDPQAPINWTRGQRCQQYPHEPRNGTGCGWSRWIQHGNSRRASGRVLDDVPKVVINGDKDARLTACGMQDLVIGGSAQALLAGQVTIVSRLGEQGLDGRPEIFVELDPHEAAGIGMTCSRVISAP